MYRSLLQIRHQQKANDFLSVKCHHGFLSWKQQCFTLIEGPSLMRGTATLTILHWNKDTCIIVYIFAIGYSNFIVKISIGIVLTTNCMLGLRFWDHRNTLTTMWIDTCKHKNPHSFPAHVLLISRIRTLKATRIFLVGLVWISLKTFCKKYLLITQGPLSQTHSTVSLYWPLKHQCPPYGR